MTVYAARWRSTLRTTRPIWYVVFFALLLRALLPVLVLSTGQSASVFVDPDDTPSYTEVAEQFVRTGSFSTVSPATSIREPGPDVLRTPGYPLLLALGMALGNMPFVTIALQVLMGGLTVYLIYKTAMLIWNRERVALLGAILYALDPVSIVFTSKLLTETLFATLIAILIYCLVAYFKGARTRYLLGGAVALAAATYVRPISYYLPALLTLVLLADLLIRSRRNIRQLGAIVGFLAVSAGLIGLWQARNARAINYSEFSAISDINWYFYQGASVLAEKNGVPFREQRKNMGYGSREDYFVAHPEQRTWTQSQMYQYMGEEGKRLVFQNLPTYMPIHVLGMGRVLISPGGRDYIRMFDLSTGSGQGYEDVREKQFSQMLSYLLNSNAGLMVVFGVTGLPLLLTLLGAVIAVTRRSFRVRAVVPVIVIGGYLLVMSGGIHTGSRFRHPIMPAISLVGGFGLAVAYGSYHRFRARRRQQASVIGQVAPEPQRLLFRTAPRGAVVKQARSIAGATRPRQREMRVRSRFEAVTNE